MDYLQYHGYSVVTKRAKEFTNDQGVKRTKGNMDIEIGVDMMNFADHIDHAILCSGDGDFRYLVKALQDKGKRVSVISSIKTDPVMIADELRRQADNFIEIMDLKQHIERVSDGKGRA
jgi:uncharacterized LabA/DUF88 family protein